ncbi:mitochondrial import receptor subunit TOM20 homolog, partial [Anarrhichthys ocellatus]|uniref:mitochondrial import receptor subunit TOM20 homolog n=1 Tax=Anarrhichthys ocellatus TaxID=433405 RepID=UPI0012EDA501
LRLLTGEVLFTSSGLLRVVWLLADSQSCDPHHICPSCLSHTHPNACQGHGRRKQKAAKERAGMAKLPDLKDAEAVQKFFLEEIQLGEELLAQGDYEKGVDHLTNAIAVCGQPQQLLQVLQQTLPPPVFQMLLTKLPSISQRIVSAQSLSEDDIE